MPPSEAQHKVFNTFSLIFHSFLHCRLVFPTTGVFVFPAYYLFHIIKCLCLLAWLSLSWPFADPSGSELCLFLYVYAFKCKSHNNSRELKIVSWRCCCCVLLCSGVNNQSQKRKKSCVCLWTGTALGIRVAGKTVVALWRGFADRVRKWRHSHTGTARSHRVSRLPAGDLLITGVDSQCVEIPERFGATATVE